MRCGNGGLKLKQPWHLICFRPYVILRPHFGGQEMPCHARVMYYGRSMVKVDSREWMETAAAFNERLPITRLEAGEAVSYTNISKYPDVAKVSRHTAIFIHSFVMFCYVFLCHLWGPAWAVGSYNSRPPALVIPQILIFKTLRMTWTKSAEHTWKCCLKNLGKWLYDVLMVWLWCCFYSNISYSVSKTREFSEHPSSGDPGWSGVALASVTFHNCTQHAREKIGEGEL